MLCISSRRDLGLQSTFPCNFSCVCIHTCFAITYVHRDENFISNIFYNHSPLYILNLKRNNSASLVSQLAFDTPHLYFLSPGDPGRPPWPHPDEKLWSGDLNSGPTLHPLTHPPSTDPHSLMLEEYPMNLYWKSVCIVGILEQHPTSQQSFTAAT